MRFNFDVDRIITSPMNYTIARRYDNYDSVEQIEVRPIYQGYVIYGRVHNKNRIYECTIQTNLNKELVSYDCQCYFCTGQSPCAHVGAVLLKLNKLDINRLPFVYRKIDERQEEEEHQRFLENLRERRRQAMERQRQEFILHQQQEMEWMINRQKYLMKSRVDSLVDTNTYSIYPDITYNNGSWLLSYRIGTNQKKYVIRNIPDLVDNFKDRDIFAYGRNMTICHDKKYFDDFSISQLMFLEKHCGVLIRNGASRYITLDEDFVSILHDFFELYEEYESPLFTCAKTTIKIPFGLENTKEGYELSLKNRGDWILGNNELYLLPERTDQIPYRFERVILDSGKVLSTLLMKMKQNGDKMYIHRDHIKDFSKYILNQISDYITLDGAVLEEVAIEEKRIVVSGDVDENGNIVFDVTYYDSNNQTTHGFNGGELTYNQEIVETVFKNYAKDIQEGKVYIDAHDEKGLAFCKEGVLKLQPYSEVYISEALKRISSKPKYAITVGVRVENNLIHMEIDSEDLPREELSGILSAYRKKKKFYRLKNGDMIPLESEDLEALDTLMENFHLETKELKKDAIEIDKNRMFALDEAIKKEENLEITRENSYQKLIDQFKEVSAQDIQIPEAYETILRDYQKEGYRWLYTMHQYGFNGVLADDMGLGKTLQVIALLEGIEKQHPSLVVCPASLVYNWEDEIKKFSKTLKAVCVVGTKAQRLKIIQESQSYDLLITSYDYMRRDTKEYNGQEFEYVILDEAQNIKNQKTKNAQSVKEIQAAHRLALTGTPIENTLAELWSIFDFLMPDYLFNYHYFKKNYETPIVKHEDQNLSQQLKTMVSPFILRRTKKQVLKELPDKIEHVQSIPFENEEKKLYYANLAQINEQLASMTQTNQISDIEVLAMLTRLRQLCIDPRLVYENVEKASSKVNALMELLDQLKENNQNVLVFSAFPSIFGYIEEELKEKGLSYLILTGKNNKEQRKEMVEVFQKGEIDVFMISLKAGGTGLNLTQASAVIHIDPWWNISAQNQATDRAHRIGQNNVVDVFKLVMKNSIEEQIVKLQEKKKELSDLFVEDNHGTISKMTKAEIIQLFKTKE